MNAAETHRLPFSWNLEGLAPQRQRRESNLWRTSSETAAPGGRRALCDDIFHFLSPRRGSIAWSLPRGVGEQTVLAIALQSFPIPIMHLCRQLLLCPSQKPPESSKAAAVLVSSPITSENAFQFSRLSSSTRCWLSRLQRAEVVVKPVVLDASQFLSP